MSHHNGQAKYVFVEKAIHPISMVKSNFNCKINLITNENRPKFFHYKPIDHEKTTFHHHIFMYINDHKCTKIHL